MIKIEEIVVIALAIIVASFSAAFTELNKFLLSALFLTIIFVVYTGTKKIAAYLYESEEETQIWSFQRYGFYKKSYFKYPIPIGIILPFIIPLFSMGLALFPLPWLAITQSKIKPKKERAAKKHGFWSFSEMTEYHIAVIHSWAFVSLLVLFIIAILLNISQLASLSILFAIFNLLPLGKLDGSRVFFGFRPFYFVLLGTAIIFFLLQFIL